MMSKDGFLHLLHRHRGHCLGVNHDVRLLVLILRQHHNDYMSDHEFSFDEVFPMSKDDFRHLLHHHPGHRLGVNHDYISDMRKPSSFLRYFGSAPLLSVFIKINTNRLFGCCVCFEALDSLCWFRVRSVER
jgi:hypothetical protein